jgi:hypothetical protein
MARDRAARDSRYLCEEHSDDQRAREREERRYRRRHRHRDDFDYDYEDHKQRRERRKADEARRHADLDIDELRARRESYYSRPETDRRRDSQRMAHDTRGDRENERPRTSIKEVRRDGTVRRKKRRETVDAARDDEYVYGPPRSRPLADEATVRRSSAIRRSDEGGSSNRTQHTPLSGSRSASLRKDDVPMLSRTMSARDPRVYMTRPSARRTSTTKLPAAPAAPAATPAPLSRSHTVSAKDTRRSSGLLATFFRAPPRPQTAVLQKEVIRFVSVYADCHLS